MQNLFVGKVQSFDAEKGRGLIHQHNTGSRLPYAFHICGKREIESGYIEPELSSKRDSDKTHPNVGDLLVFAVEYHNGQYKAYGWASAEKYVAIEPSYDPEKVNMRVVVREPSFRTIWSGMGVKRLLSDCQNHINVDGLSLEVQTRFGWIACPFPVTVSVI